MSSALWINADELAAGRPYAERPEPDPGWHDRAAEFLLANAAKPVLNRLRDPARALAQIVEHAHRHEAAFRAATDAELATVARGLRAPLRRKGFAPELVGKCFALVQEAAARTIGRRHYDVQLMAGWALLQGKLVEMATGEGKTIAATLPASTVALAGYPAHVITVNDYLAKRDSDEMAPVYRFLGLSTAAVIQGMPKPERRQAYAASVTYCTNKELAFDYLRDRVAVADRGSRLHLSLDSVRGQRDDELVLRGLYFGIVDEADSVFIDEARTPLILSSSVGPAEDAEQCKQALDLARQLHAASDYITDWAGRNVTLTSTGREKLDALTAELDGVWTSVRAGEELVTQALNALILYQRDQHYVVGDGKVQIVDESTGRLMPDRSWERGLHQLIETKEGCELTERRETLARLTYQRLFRRYIRLSGMTGTGQEVAREVKSVYGLDVVRIPLHRPSRRVYATARVCADRAEKWREVADAVARLSVEQQRPVLIGTRSVQSSEELSAVLNERGIEHTLLNAKQDAMEASIVALAGQPARITVATNMAGRGTDIRLGEGVAERGGLHVILTEYHDSPRVDRQLFGRCARQGDPGSCQAIVSFEDELFVTHTPTAAAIARRLAKGRSRIHEAMFARLKDFAQYCAERRNASVRVQNVDLDRRLDRVLAFSGKRE